MGHKLVVWMLILTFSASWETQMETVGKSTTELTYHHDALYYKKETHIRPTPLSSHEGQQRLPSDSTGGHGGIMGDSENQLTAARNGLVHTVPRGNGRQKRSLKILELQNTGDVSMLSRDEDSLGQMLAAVVKEQLKDCALVLAHDAGYSVHAVLHHLLLLPNPRQVVHVNTTPDWTRIIWTSSVCRGYLFLVDEPEPLLTFARTYHDTWDYSGRFILVGLSLQHLKAFVDSYIGERTEHVVGVVKSDTEGEWLLYMNQLYWGPGVRRINTWYHHRFTRQLDLFPDKLSDLQGAVLKVSTFHFEPCIFFERAENGTVVLRYGTDIEVVRAVASVLNITLEFTETPKGETWGERLENGSWFGLMGQLQRNEVDIGLAFLFISDHWFEAIDMTAPYTAETMCFLTRTEPPLPHWQALAFPFHKWTWLAVVVGLTVSGPLLFLLARCSHRCGGGELRNLQSLSYSWYYAFGMHFAENHASLPRKTTTRIYVLFLWLYIMILTIVYSTTLMSFLLVKKQPAVMETFKELYESGLEVASLGKLLRYGLVLSSDPYLQGLARVFKWYDSQEKVFPPVLEGKAVYLGNRITLDYLIKNRFTRRGVSRVRIMKEYYAPYSVAMALQRHSPLKRKFDQLMGWIQQGGLVGKFYLDALQLDASLKKAGISGEASASGQEVGADGVIPLSLDHMQGLFLITCCGWLCSLLSFTLEKTVFLDY